MTSLQVIVNIVLAVVAYLLVSYLVAFALPAPFPLLLGLLAAFLVFAGNLAGHFGVR